MNQYKIFLPVNLNLEELIKKYPPQFSYKVDGFKYAIKLVLELPVWNKDLFEKEPFPFTPLYSKLLQRVLHDYQMYIDYLLKVKVLETDGHYTNIGKSKSYGYRLNQKYRSPVKESHISHPKILRNIELLFREQNTSGNDQYPHLLNWFEGLHLDESKARQIREELYKANIKGSRKKSIQESDVKDFAYRYMIQAFVDRIYQFKIDETGYRLHTNLTNLKSEFRSCLSYKGEQLVSIDLCNSQPFLATILFNTHFYEFSADDQRLSINKLSYRSQKALNPLIEEIKTFLLKVNKNKAFKLFNFPSINTCLTTLYSLSTYIPHYRGALIYPMFGKFSEEYINDEFLNYISQVENGCYYEYMQTHIKRINGETNLTRKEVKKLTLTTFFANPEDSRLYFKIQQEAFCQLFPTVYELFSLIKSRSYNTLAILLQNIESVLFLKQIAGRITTERPDLPIFTLHDSILTTAGNEDYVELVMKQELERAIDITPKFKREYLAS